MKADIQGEHKFPLCQLDNISNLIAMRFLFVLVIQIYY